MYKYFLLLLLLLLTSCIEVEDFGVKELPLPCIDGWQFDYTGQPMVSPDTGAQLTCPIDNGSS